VISIVGTTKLIDSYIFWMKNEGKDESTIKDYPVLLEKLVEWYVQTENTEFTPDKVTTLHLHDFVAYISKVKQYSPAYVNKIIASLKTFYKFALETELVSYNPMEKVKMKRSMQTQAAPKWLTKLELAKFFHAIESVKNEKKKARDLAICRLMAQAGLRVNEVTALSPFDICLEKRRENVTIRDGKGDKFRIVPLNKDLIESLENWMVYWKEKNSDAYSPLFFSERSSRITDRGIRYMITSYAKSAGLIDVSCHTLRHTFCKNLANAGVRLEQIAYLAGHESIETTKVYLLPSDDDVRKNVELISEKR